MEAAHDKNNDSPHHAHISALGARPSVRRRHRQFRGPERLRGVRPRASPLAQSAGPGSPDAPPPTIPEDVEEMIDSITQTSLVPVLVQGLVSAGGHTWPIPATFFAQDLTAGDPILVLTDCAVFGLGRGTRDSPTPTVMVGHQATLDRAAGD